MKLVNKTCPKCSIEKPISDFYRRKTGPRIGEYYEKCKECMKFRGRNYYYQNHERQLKLAKKRNIATLVRSMEFLIKVKNSRCKDCCKYYPPWVMDFDHRNPRIKTDNIATLRRIHNLRRVSLEIDKCDLVCANCHRTRTLLNSKSRYNSIIKKLEKEGYKFKWKLLSLPR